jgi:ABC-type transport system involved in cytochrome c biogenesis permease subunit
MSKYIPGVATALTAMFFVAMMIPRSSPPGEFDFDTVGRLPIVERGRVKPLDTLARIDLQLVSDRQDYKEFGTWDDFVGGKYHTRAAVKWLLDTLAYSEIVQLVDMRLSGKGHPPIAPTSWEHHVFRIENGQVLDLLKLKERPGFFRYSFAEMKPQIEEFYEQAQRAQQLDQKERTLFDAKLIELGNRFEVYSTLLRSEQQQLKPEIFPHLIPPTKPGEEWMTLTDALIALVRNDPAELQDARSRAPAKVWLEFLKSYRENKVDQFNRQVAQYYAEVAELVPGDVTRANIEVFYNRFSAFYYCSILYAFIFVIGCLSWVVWPRTLNRTAFWVMTLVVVVHTIALTARMIIQGRPPVTNLYSSAIYIGWTGVLTCLVVEYFFRNSVAMVAGALLGLLSLIVAHFLSLSGDTMEMMQAVLDTNFWLATHVTTVTFGYTATFLAGMLGVAYVLLGLFRVVVIRLGESDTVRTSPIYRVLCWTALIGIYWWILTILTTALGIALLFVFLFARDKRYAVPAPTFKNLFRLDERNWLFRPDNGAVLSKAIYGIVCFAMFLSFVGTVLGGIWADQSWGRFWGWDPKENGALLVVLWNALILHARWAGMVKQRGVAVLAVGGNIVTVWSWFGTNLLPVGLHSYGRMEGAMMWLLIFAGTQVFIMLLGVLPLPYWKPLTAPRTREPLPNLREPSPALV